MNARGFIDSLTECSFDLLGYLYAINALYRKLQGKLILWLDELSLDVESRSNG